MNTQETKLLKLLKSFDDNGCSDHLILIGSWAEYLYCAAGILPDYEAVIRTLDIDFLVKNLRRPVPSINIISLAKEEGFYVEEDCLTGVTRLLSPDGLEVEFLIEQKGKGSETALKTNLGITAQALRHLDLLRDNTLEIRHLGIKVCIPVPEAFVLHKMIINSERKHKTEKDQTVINRMYPHLNLDKFNELLGALTKKERKVVNQYLEEIFEKIKPPKNSFSSKPLHLPPSADSRAPGPAATGKSFLFRQERRSAKSPQWVRRGKRRWSAVFRPGDLTGLGNQQCLISNVSPVPAKVQ